MIPKINSAHGSETRNIINRAIEVLNVHGKTIQDLVAEGQLTEEQYANLINIINGLVKSGEISKEDLESNLKSELEQFGLQITHNTSELNNKIDKDGAGQVGWSNINQSTREMMLGNNPMPTVGRNSTGKENIIDNSVGVEHVDFLDKNTTLYTNEDATTHEGIINISNPNFNGASPGRFVYFINIKKGSKYRLIIDDSPNHDRTRISLFTNKPISGTVNLPPVEKLVGDDDYKGAVYFEARITGALGIFLNSSGLDVPFELTEVSDVKSNIQLASDLVNEDSASFIIKSKKNLYANGFYKPGFLYTTDKGESLQYRESSPNRRVRFVKIVPNKTYTVSFYGGDRSTLYLSSQNIEVTDQFQHGQSELLKEIQNSGPSPVTFTSESDSQYLLVYLSSDGTHVPFQVEEGENSTEYEQPYLLDERLFFGEHYPKAGGGGTVSSSQKHDRIYQSENITGMNDVLVNASIDYIYDKYDGLMAEFPQLITNKRLVGYGGDENREIDENLPIYEYTIKPLQTTQLEQDGVSALLSEAPMMLLTSGVHGQEKSASYGLYSTIEQMLYNPQRNERVNKLKSGYQFKIIPIVNPWGFNNNERVNAAGRDINRDLVDLIEIETQLLFNWLNENKGEAFAYFDFHNFGTNRDRHQTSLSYHISPVPDVNKMYDLMIRKLSLLWKETHLKDRQELGDVAYGFNLSEVYEGVPMTVNEAYHGLNIPLTGTPESVYTGTEQLHSNTVLQWTVEVYMNYLLFVDDKFGF